MENLILNDIPKFDTLQQFAKRFPEMDPSAIFAAINLLHTSDQLNEAIDIHFQRHDTSKARFMILMLLKRYSEKLLSPSELADKACCSRATMTGLIDGLERDGFIERTPNENDRRGFNIKLTNKGENFMKNMLPDHFKRISKLMEHLTESERIQFVELLQKVCAGLPALKNETIE